jgi:membrane-associated protein
LVKQSYLDKTHQYFEKYGGYTIIVGRFVPFVRTFAPFMAGIGQLNARTFLSYNVIGAVLWICSMVGLGYFFGNLPWVKQNLKLVTIALVVLPALPVFFKVWQEYRSNRLAK